MQSRWSHELQMHCSEEAEPLGPREVARPGPRGAGQQRDTVRTQAPEAPAVTLGQAQPPQGPGSSGRRGPGQGSRVGGSGASAW